VLNWDRIRKRYEAELLGNIVPFWEHHAIDRERGGYFTCLDRDGSVYDTEKYMWMQWRVVYMFAELCLTPWAKKEWLGHAVSGFDFLTRHGKDETGAYYFSLNRDGVPSTAAYNIYSECFAAMGSASLYKATGDLRCRDEAVAAMGKYLDRMSSPKGRWEKSLGGRKPWRSLGHYMMLANLGSVMTTRLDDPQYEMQTGEAVHTVLDLFTDQDAGLLMENIGPENDRTRFDYSSPAGRHLNPGHGLEALWFILQYAESKGDEAVIARASDLILSTLEWSWDRRFGGIYYFMDRMGKPHAELTWDMKLWWVHCEAIVAVLYAYRLTRRKEFVSWFKRLDAWTWKRFPDRRFGEWYAYLNRRGEPTHALKGGKWKTFFHLPRMLLVSCGLMRNL
jgi:N-acylglucosamine 2-epimerase